MVKQGKRPRKGPLVKHKRTPNPKTLKKLALAIVITIVAAGIYVKLAPHTYDAKQQVQLENKSQQLKSTLHDLQQQKVQDSAQQKKLDNLQKQLQDTQQQLQSKKAAAMVYAATLPDPGATDCGSDPYLAHIYQNESGCCPTKWQGETVCPDTYYATYSTDAQVGYGLCQSTPAGKMASAGADWTTSWEEQNAWCTQYAVARYGSTELAWAHWQVFHNW